jgi:hypothetical protein
MAYVLRAKTGVVSGTPGLAGGSAGRVGREYVVLRDEYRYERTDTETDHGDQDDTEVARSNTVGGRLKEPPGGI